MANPHNDKLFNELRALNLPSDQYVVFGSGPMGIRGMREIHDVDIFVTEKLWQALLKNNNSENGKSLRLTANIEAIREWFPGEWKVEELIAGADIIDGIRFAKLEMVYAWKVQRKAPKDEKDLELLESHFKTSKRNREIKVCGICGAPHYAKGLCKKHYNQNYRRRQRAKFGRGGRWKNR